MDATTDLIDRDEHGVAHNRGHENRTMFERVLIANRGEIACRIAATCRRLGIHTIGVYSDADADARHMRMCDEAWYIGPDPAHESYLESSRILEVALKADARAIHPGYGLLSENAEFARACARIGLPFIGPSPETIEAMGSKRTARRIMQEAGVPIVPGYHGRKQSESALANAAERVGYPVLLKPTAGGGGKGMRRVDRADEFAAALDAARREAESAFGSSEMLIEKYLDDARHVEVQILADRHGQCIHLFDRDCSIQRRYQKIIEEAPAPKLSLLSRQRMQDAALRAAAAVGYVGAGTVAFLVTPDGAACFLEMNTRLQVEHPVTEMITDLDLIEWQIRLTEGERLGLNVRHAEPRGHALEARIYAEDPACAFRPSSGRIMEMRLPEPEPGVRVDTGFDTGDQISDFYDPLIAKVIVHGLDRGKALRKLRCVLDSIHVVGPATNLPMLRMLAGNPAVAAATCNATFVEHNLRSLVPAITRPPDYLLATACLAKLRCEEHPLGRQPPPSSDPYSPWDLMRGWDIIGGRSRAMILDDGREETTIEMEYLEQGYRMELPGGTSVIDGYYSENAELTVSIDGRRFRASVVSDGDRLAIIVEGMEYVFRLRDPTLPRQGP